MIYLVVGVPASGKSWVCEQLKDKIQYVHHDLFIGMSGNVYAHEVLKADEVSDVLAESPFGVSSMLEALYPRQVEPVFIVEPDGVLITRYLGREHKPLPPGRLKLQETYRKRAAEMGAFCGTSAEVLEYLKRRIK